VLWPEAGYTKGDLVAFYRAIAPAMLPYLAERPIMLVRYPDGIHGKSFYQWRVPPSVPGWVRTIKIRNVEVDGKDTEVFLVDDAESLAFVANLGTMPIHVLAARATTLTECDFFTLDFDVKNASLQDAIPITWTLRRILEEIELPGYVKTSGQTGLHVFVPLGPGVAFPIAQTMADLLGKLLCTRHPDKATMERIVARRGPRVYIDTGQTGPKRTIVAPWAVRATAEASVSTPIRWDELVLNLDPKVFTIRTAPERFAKEGDPMAPMLTDRPNVLAAVERLEGIVRKASR
jgi:bifunctional non-homologous end joining protein LigD